MIIRKATLSDLDDIIKIEQEWISEYPCWGKKGFLKEFDKENSFTFVAVVDDIIVGFINFWDFSDLIEINSVVVSKKFLRRGIARVLLKEVFSYAKDNSIKRIVLEVNEKNIAALKLYESFGFKMYNVRKKYYDFNYDAIMMEVFL